MSKKKHRNPRPGPKLTDSPRLEPETRVANRFDDLSIAEYPVAEPGKMGFRVVDDCAQEHIM